MSNGLNQNHTNEWQKGRPFNSTNTPITSMSLTPDEQIAKTKAQNLETQDYYCISNYCNIS